MSLVRFYSTAIAEDFRRKQWYKIVIFVWTIAAALSVPTTFYTLFEPIKLQAPSWFWVVIRYLFWAVVVMFFVLAFIAVYNHHVRVRQRLVSKHKRGNRKLINRMANDRDALNIKLREYEKEISERATLLGIYEERLAPKLDILFENNVPFVKHEQESARTGKQGLFKMLRVGIKNLSSEQLYGVTAELEDFYMHGSSYEGVPLRIMNNVQPPFRESFSIRPLRTEYVDVAMWNREDMPQLATLCLTRSFGFVPHINVAEPVTLTIVASASDVQPCRKRFILSLDGNGVPQMETADQ